MPVVVNSVVRKAIVADKVLSNHRKNISSTEIKGRTAALNIRWLEESERKSSYCSPVRIGDRASTASIIENG